MDDAAVPRLVPGARLHEDAARGWVLLSPEQVTELEGPAADILRLCDGARSVAAIVAELRVRYPGADADVVAADVRAFLRDLAEQRLLTTA